MNAAGEQDRGQVALARGSQAHGGDGPPFPGLIRRLEDRAERGKQEGQVLAPAVHVIDLHITVVARHAGKQLCRGTERLSESLCGLQSLGQQLFDVTLNDDFISPESQ